MPITASGKFPNRLGELMNRLGLSQAEVVRGLNTDHKEMNKQTFNKLFLGKTRLSKEWAVALEPVLGLDWKTILDPADFIAKGSVEMVKRSGRLRLVQSLDSPNSHDDNISYVRVFDAAAAAGVGALNVKYPEARSLFPFPSAFLRSISRAPVEELAIINVVGDSMMPTLHSGDQISIDQTVKSVGRDALYVLFLNNDLQVKRISLNHKSRTLRVASDNPLPATEDGVPEDAIKILGRVMWFGRKL